MPYIDGQRVTNEEWTRRFGSTRQLYTGASGENPAPEPTIDEELGTVKVVPKAKGKAQAGGNRSAKSATATRAAIADALGVKDDSSTLDDIDVSGLDAPAPGDTEVAGPAADSTEAV